MTVTVSPTETSPTHHLSLSDGVNTVGIVLRNPTDMTPNPKAISRTPLNRTGQKIVQGDSTYEDTELPYSSRVQSDWSGGRGLLDFERDTRRFYDSYCLDTTRGEIVLGPKATTTTGLQPAVYSTTGLAEAYDLHTGQRYYSDIFNAGDIEYPAGAIYGVYVRVWGKVGSPGPLNVSIRANSGGNPGTILASKEQACTTGNNAFMFAAPVNLTATTTHHVVVYGASPCDGSNYYQLTVTIGGIDLKSSDGVTWSAASHIAKIALITEESTYLTFEYKGALYAIERKLGGGASRLYCNGYRGIAASNASNLGVINTGLTLDSTDELVGKVVKITAGQGSTEETPWRVITASTTGGVCTVSPSWKIVHTTSTEYVILGVDTWQEIAETGLTKPVTDVLVVDDLILFAQGDDTPIRRARFYNNAGTWTTSYGDDTTNVASFLALQTTEAGTRKVWKAKAASCEVASANAVTTGTNMTYGTDIVCGSTNSRITGLAVYGDPAIPYILKEDGIGAIRNDVYAEAPINEMKAVKSEENGRAWLVHGVYLYFSLHQSLERYYNDDLSDIGPNRDEGLPSDRQGPIYHMVGYPGRFYACVDGGLGGYSSILCYNGGWHEIYRGALGDRILRLHVQVMPGSTVDRLWFSEGDDMKWIPIAINPRKTTGYTYQTGGYLITSYLDCKYKDLTKLFKSVKLTTENLSAGHYTISLAYRLDNDTAWTTVATAFTTSPSQEINLSATYAITGKRIQFRLALNTDLDTVTPVINAFVLEAMIAETTKYAYSLPFLVGDNNSDLDGEEDETQRAETILNILDGWASTPTALLMRSVFSPDDNKYVKVQPFVRRPYELSAEEQVESHFLQMTVVEV